MSKGIQDRYAKGCSSVISRMNAMKPETNLQGASYLAKPYQHPSASPLEPSSLLLSLEFPPRCHTPLATMASVREVQELEGGEWFRWGTICLVCCRVRAIDGMDRVGVLTEGEGSFSWASFSLEMKAVFRHRHSHLCTRRVRVVLRSNDAQDCTFNITMRTHRFATIFPSVQQRVHVLVPKVHRHVCWIFLPDTACLHDPS
jgi:hypothetical protein